MTRLKRSAAGLAELVQHPKTSIDEKIAKRISSAKYKQSLQHLARYRFWSSGNASILPLWKHQRTAIELVAAYLAADRRLPAEGNVQEAGLLKLPTGTGKSGVIAVVARCMPKVRRILILTARTALAEQLRRDIRWRFWMFLGFDANSKSLFEADAATAGAPIGFIHVEELLPTTAKEILVANASSEGLAVVGTFSALDQIRRIAESSKASDEHHVIRSLQNFDLVLVDEGHYEPAPSWSRTVRQLNLPTVLLSATPYRNDYKSFRVRGRFIFNYSIGEACEERVVRNVEFLTAPAATTLSDVERFISVLDKLLPNILNTSSAYTRTPRVIVRAAEFTKLCALQEAIAKHFNERPILIHHQVPTSDSKLERYHQVNRARESPHSATARFWLHESKLLEGIDDSSFVAIAMFDPFTNTRQLVQQVGRALRSTDPKRRRVQKAWVISAPEVYERILLSWKRYLAFEKYAFENPISLVKSEAALPDRLMEYMPELQYIAGEFRPRLAFEEPPQAPDFRIPASAAVYDLPANFDLARFALQVEEALLAEDRFKPMAIEGMPAGSFGFAYYGWRSSPYLTVSFFPEWTLGLCVVIKVGDLLLVQDTEGIVFDASELGMSRVEGAMLLKAMPEGTSKTPVRISRVSLFSLDTSPRAIRTMAMRTASFSDTFTDLLDPVLYPTTAFGFVNGRGRYVGVQRGRLSDNFPEPLALDAYCTWAKERAAELTSGRRPNSVFGRYARVRGRLLKDEAAPQSILLDFDDTLLDLLEDSASHPKTVTDIDYNDLCADVQNGQFQIEIGGKKLLGTVEFLEKTQRYRIRSDELDAKIPTKSIDPERPGPTLTSLINRNQSFRIIVPEGVVYAAGKFYEPNLEYVRPDGEIPLLGVVASVPALASATSEKGEKFFDKTTQWRNDSVFGLVKHICDSSSANASWGILYKDLRAFPYIICDDDGEEIGDFIAISPELRRVALIHAKAAKKAAGISTTALQVVGRQVMASLAFCSSVSRQPKIKKNRWAKQVNANGKLLQLDRVFRNEGGKTVAELEEMASAALADRSWNREIWILAGNLISRSAMEDAIKRNESNRERQFLMYFESLVTGCGRGNSSMRMYCNE